MQLLKPVTIKSDLLYDQRKTRYDWNMCVAYAFTLCKNIALGQNTIPDDLADSINLSKVPNWVRAESFLLQCKRHKIIKSFYKWSIAQIKRQIMKGKPCLFIVWHVDWQMSYKWSIVIDMKNWWLHAISAIWFNDEWFIVRNSYWPRWKDALLKYEDIKIVDKMFYMIY